MHRYEYLEMKMCKELQNLDEKYRNDQMMSEGDLKRADMLAHALKSLVSYEVMSDSQNDYQYNRSNTSYNQMGGNSYGYDGRGRDMNQSGHYPPFYPENNRRW